MIAAEFASCPVTCLTQGRLASFRPQMAKPWKKYLAAHLRGDENKMKLSSQVRL